VQVAVCCSSGPPRTAKVYEQCVALTTSPISTHDIQGHAARRNPRPPAQHNRTGHNSLMPRSLCWPGGTTPPDAPARAWPLAAGLAAGVALDALLGDPRRFHPVAGFGRAAAALEARDYADSRRRARRRLRPGRRRPRRAPAPPYPGSAAVAGRRGRARGVGRHRCPFATP
jgi:hypothetical protein